jgi:hypothetical protein
MARRLLSALGIMAMLLAFLPGVVDAAGAADLPLCCNGVICPLHQIAAKIICDTDSSSTHDADLERCPDQTSQYTVALLFVRVAPVIFFAQPLAGKAGPSVAMSPAKVSAQVPYPPPRLVPA